MTTTARAAAADFKCEILGQPYILAEFTGHQWAEFDQWIAGRIVSRIRGSTQDLQLEERQEYIDAAIRLAVRIDSRMGMVPHVHEVANSIALSLDGQIEQARLMLRRQNLPTERIALLFDTPGWVEAYYAKKQEYLNPPKEPAGQPAPPPASTPSIAT